jgi:hypothetical protein
MNKSIVVLVLALLGLTTSLAANSAKFDTSKFYLGKHKALMPQMIEAAELVITQSPCVEITDGAT